MQKIDKVALVAMIVMSLTISVLLLGSKACGTECFLYVKPQITNFSWQNKTIGREDQAFLLKFNRPVNHDQVEQSLVIDPPLAGKFSWAGNKLAYTLSNPVPYGEKYRLFFDNSRQDNIANQNSTEQSKQLEKEEEIPEIEPFLGQFRSRDRAFAYIGGEGINKDRLILYNWTTQQKTVLTPKNLVVLDFESYPHGDRILFSAIKKKQGLDQLKLYSVSTGINLNSAEEFESQIQLIVDSEKYQNNKYDLSQDGKIIVVQRINRSQPTDFGLWKITENSEPQLLEKKAVGDFLITPDSQAIAVAQGEGIALLSLTKRDPKALNYLPQFGRVVSFSADGSAAVMVNYNQESKDLRFTKSLYYVNNRGVQKELINLEGSIIDCEFNPSATYVYCLLTKLEFPPNITPEEAKTVYLEKPYIAEIELATSTIIPLLGLPEYQDGQLSVAPDGLGVLFDQVLTADNPNAQNFQNQVPEAESSVDNIIKSRLWILIPPIDSSEVHQLEELPLIGFHPQWLP